MITAADIIAEARSWVGTPFHHQGRVKGAGVDCIGLVIGVGWALNLFDYDYTAYGRIPNPVIFGRELNTQMHRLSAIEPACVPWFAFRHAPQHVGIVTDEGTLIHAYAVAGKVVETALDPQWIARARGIFRFPGVEA